ncbi:uncharacterized protein F5147DRAFT_777317 [Suillus discolor]|uniref:Fungal-type protein kinase domain-containing protein n=1 Tax=Suillus discolor TaxID=1912936 RepID=A0A9P7JQS2_9AGAM|nr:uncharacterized protein F5147DRAFT_777317 [Suillus discolor]KAG2099623.1 hypothetical protein F5147DRAFT_777317 [Suillus discolor]
MVGRSKHRAEFELHSEDADVPLLCLRLSTGHDVTFANPKVFKLAITVSVLFLHNLEHLSPKPNCFTDRITMATPHTPPSQKSQLPPPDTALVPRHTSQSDYRTGDLKLGREAVLADLERYLQVPFVSLAKCVGLMPSPQRLQDMRDDLIQREILTENDLKWKAFIRPANSKRSEEGEPIDLKLIPSKKPHLSAMVDVPDSGRLSVFLPAQLGIVGRKDAQIAQRVHARIAFDDGGVAIKDGISLADSLRCLSGGLKGLYYLHKAGWIHGDFSVGNVIWVVGDNGSIGKLEFLKMIPLAANSSAGNNAFHFDRSRTSAVPFPTPVHCIWENTSCYKPPAPPPFRTNFLHDIESVWWAYTWIFFYHTDTITANSHDSFDVDAQLRQYQLAFPGVISQETRRDFFTRITELQRTCESVLSDRCLDVCHNIGHFASTLQDSHEKAEKKYPSLMLDDSLREDMHAKAAEYLDDAQKEAGDIKLCRLLNLRKQKRPREEGDTFPTPDDAGKRIRQG